MLGEKHKRSSTVQEEELTIEGRHHLLLLHKQTHDKKSIAESLYAHTNKARLTARLTACEVGIFYHNSRNYTHPLFEKPLKFVTMSIFMVVGLYSLHILLHFLIH